MSYRDGARIPEPNLQLERCSPGRMESPHPLCPEQARGGLVLFSSPPAPCKLDFGGSRQLVTLNRALCTKAAWLLGLWAARCAARGSCPSCAPTRLCSQSGGRSGVRSVGCFGVLSWLVSGHCPISSRSGRQRYPRLRDFLTRPSYGRRQTRPVPGARQVSACWEESGEGIPAREARAVLPWGSPFSGVLLSCKTGQ